MSPVALVKHARIPVFDLCTAIFRVRGSVIPRSSFFAFPCACSALLLKILQENDGLPDFIQSMEIMNNNAAYTGFSFVMGFLFVFRTSQAYNRFWEGVTCGHRMYAEWFDFASSVIAFTKYSTAGETKTQEFHHRLARLLSLLHGGASATLSGEDAHNIELIDIDGLEEEVFSRIVTSEHPTSLIAQWIQELVMEGLHDGVVAAPPPIVSRCFQEFANGMVQFHDAIKIQCTIFPFPYTQMSGILLTVHLIITPFVMCQWVQWYAWVFMLTFMQVLIFWSLYFTAVEIEYPFRQGGMSHDTCRIQREFNKQLLILIDPLTRRIPTLSQHAMMDVPALSQEASAHQYANGKLQRADSKREPSPFLTLQRSNRHTPVSTPRTTRTSRMDDQGNKDLHSSVEMYSTDPLYISGPLTERKSISTDINGSSVMNWSSTSNTALHDYSPATLTAPRQTLDSRNDLQVHAKAVVPPSHLEFNVVQEVKGSSTQLIVNV